MGLLDGSEGLPEGPEGLPDGSGTFHRGPRACQRALKARQRGLSVGSDCLLEGPEDQPKGLEGLSEGSGGLPEGPIVDVVCQYVADINVYTALFCKSPLTVKNMYLGDLDQLVMDLAPPPQLHLHMGVVNLVMNVLINVWGLQLPHTATAPNRDCPTP